MKNKSEIVEHLKAAINAWEKGVSLFPNGNYGIIPKDKEKEINECCKKCSENFKILREELDLTYRNVYETFRQGGIETDCRIAKNRWCFGLIDFAKARLKDLTNKS